MTAPRGTGPAFLAYDLVVGQTPPAPVPGRAAALLGGWAGPDGPAIPAVAWPRSPRTGQPLRHCTTIWLPPPYRQRGPELVAVAIFQWLDEYGSNPFAPHLGQVLDRGQQTTPGDRFEAALVQARAHPQATVIVHPDTEAIYAVLFLTEAELTGPRTVRPPLAAEPFPGEKYADRIEPYAKLGTVWLVARDDPNAGLAPTAWGYQEAPGRYDRFAQEHLGGTLMSPNDAGAGRLSAYYLELSALGGFDFAANDDLAFDLAAADPLGWTRSSAL